jgi:hypothetical protein
VKATVGPWNFSHFYYFFFSFLFFKNNNNNNLLLFAANVGVKIAKTEQLGQWNQQNRQIIVFIFAKISPCSNEQAKLNRKTNNGLQLKTVALGSD